jgi:hypothetical protein
VLAMTWRRTTGRSSKESLEPEYFLAAPVHRVAALGPSQPQARDLAWGTTSGSYSFRRMRGTASTMSAALMTPPMRTMGGSLR